MQCPLHECCIMHKIYYTIRMYVSVLCMRVCMYSMCVCMYVYTYICMYVYTYIYMYVYEKVGILINVYLKPGTVSIMYAVYIEYNYYYM